MHWLLTRSLLDPPNLALNLESGSPWKKSANSLWIWQWFFRGCGTLTSPEHATGLNLEPTLSHWELRSVNTVHTQRLQTPFTVVSLLLCVCPCWFCPAPCIFHEVSRKKIEMRDTHADWTGRRSGRGHGLFAWDAHGLQGNKYMFNKYRGRLQ